MMGYFACHSNYIISVLGCTKCNESREEGTQPGPWEHKRISKEAPRLELYNQNLPLQKQVGNDLYMSWWNSKVTVSAPFANTLCAGGGRGSWLSPMESCRFSRGRSFSQADSRTRTIACDRAHARVWLGPPETLGVTVGEQELPSPNLENATSSGVVTETGEIQKCSQKTFAKEDVLAPQTQQ